MPDDRLFKLINPGSQADMSTANTDKEYEMTLHDYIDIARRRALLMLAIFIVIVLLASAVSVLLPPVYQSTGTILIESQQVSSDLIANSITGYASERIEVNKQRVMTRENLLRIIKKYGLFDDEDESRVKSEIIDDLRRRIDISLLNTDLGGRNRGKANIAFSISFEDRRPEVAYKVASELVTLFLDENIKSRVEQATETTEFLTQEADRLKEDLAKIESLVAKYKQEHADSLPEHLDMKMGMLQRLETTLAGLDRDYKETLTELKRLDLELTAAKSGSNRGVEVSELEQLKTEYRLARNKYSDAHPTIRSLKRQIESLEKSGQSGNGRAGDNLDPMAVDTELVSKIQGLIVSARGRLVSLDDQRKPMRQKITDLEQQVIKTPLVEMGLSTLLRDHSNAQKKYEEIQAKRLSAKISENLEAENKSERFTLLDPPLLPDKPVRPNRMKIFMMGLLFAIGAAIGIAMLLEVLNKRVRGRGALTTILGESPLVEIPYIPTSDEHLKKKKLIIIAIIAVVILMIVALLVVHFAYMDLDILFFKILARLG